MLRYSPTSSRTPEAQEQWPLARANENERLYSSKPHSRLSIHLSSNDRLHQELFPAQRKQWNESRWKPRRAGMPLDCTSAGRRPRLTSVNQLKVPRILLFHPAPDVTALIQSWTRRGQRAQAHARCCFITGANVLQLQANLRCPVQQLITRVMGAPILLPYFAAVSFTGLFFFF